MVLFILRSTLVIELFRSSIAIRTFSILKDQVRFLVEFVFVKIRV